jgi:hypothetical protein
MGLIISLDVSLGNDCGGVGGCTASAAGTSPGRTCQGLALRAVESTTAAHSERVSQPLRFRRPSTHRALTFATALRILAACPRTFRSDARVRSAAGARDRRASVGRLRWMQVVRVDDHVERCEVTGRGTRAALVARAAPPAA